ncbi:MAG: phosphoribosylaminoimidazole-succinocarboxamide synthase [Pseudohongiellaceae bacterium]
MSIGLCRPGIIARLLVTTPTSTRDFLEYPMSADTEDMPMSAQLDGLTLLHQGKVRDIYDIDEQSLLLVTTDRVSAFDVILSQQLESKGRVLNSLSKFWFDQTAQILPNHVIETDVSKMPAAVARHHELLAGRSTLVRRAVPVLAEFIVRGYVAGSGWSDYQKTGCISGHQLPSGLLQCAQLPEPLLTPSTKAPKGEHDEAISIEQLAHIVGHDIAVQAGDAALALYTHAAKLALSKGIILADTKIEFGLIEGELSVIDEVFTPDSSRYWSAAHYKPGRDQDSFDKQIIRNALLETDWNKQPPAPILPEAVIEQARARYFEIHRILTGSEPV